MNTEFSARLQAKQIEVMEEQEKEIKEVLRIQEKRQKQQEKHFKEWTEQAHNFIVRAAILGVAVHVTNLFMKIFVKYCPRYREK